MISRNIPNGSKLIFLLSLNFACIRKKRIILKFIKLMKNYFTLLKNRLSYNLEKMNYNWINISFYKNIHTLTHILKIYMCYATENYQLKIIPMLLYVYIHLNTLVHIHTLTLDTYIHRLHLHTLQYPLCYICCFTRKKILQLPPIFRTPKNTL